MPRKPTLLAREARAALLKRVGRLSKNTPLPTLGQLAGELDLHASTIFRILRDLSAEGIVWQSPSGKFHSASARRDALRGAPVCFVGREVWQWSRLYQEVLEGISEVCAANESPLLVLSSRLLVRQSSPSDPPVFAKTKAQSEELARLLPMIPKGCGGILLDHVWEEAVLGARRWPGCSRLQLFRDGSPACPGIGPDPEAAAVMVGQYLQKKSFRRVALVVPFDGDPAIDAATAGLRKVLTAFEAAEISYPGLSHAPAKLTRINHKLRHETPREAGRDKAGEESGLKALLAKYDAVICPEDNVALAVSGLIAPATRLIGTQGTGVLHAPHVRLRYDFRRLGRAAAANILRGTAPGVFSPKLVDPSAADDPPGAGG